MESINLSKQELRILHLICQEKNKTEISERLFIAKSTVEWHKNQMLEKTGSRNVVGLVKYALKINLINPS